VVSHRHVIAAEPEGYFVASPHQKRRGKRKLDEELDPDSPSEPAQPCNQPGGKPEAPENGVEDFSSTGHPAGVVATGLTLVQYAAAMALPLEFLRAVGLSDGSHGGLPAVRMCNI
jgi:hypothetical protein